MEARALLQAAKRGEMEALEELCRLYHPRLCRYAYALTRSREEAEDVAQETLVSMLRALPDFRGADAGKFEGWLLRIARNRVCSEARRKRPAPIPEGFEPPDPAPLPGERLEQAERRARLLRALDGLDAESREMVALRYDLELSCAQIAAALAAAARAAARRCAWALPTAPPAARRCAVPAPPAAMPPRMAGRSAPTAAGNCPNGRRRAGAPRDRPTVWREKFLQNIFILQKPRKTASFSGFSASLRRGISIAGKKIFKKGLTNGENGCIIASTVEGEKYPERRPSKRVAGGGIAARRRPANGLPRALLKSQ